MNLKPIKWNMTEIETDKYIVLFSYQTPVAYIDSDGEMVKTSKFWSRTTTRHINQWFEGFARKGDIREAPQSELDNLLNEVK